MLQSHIIKQLRVNNSVWKPTMHSEVFREYSTGQDHAYCIPWYELKYKTQQLIQKAATIQRVRSQLFLELRTSFWGAKTWFLELV